MSFVDFSNWLTWLSLGIGLVVSYFVYQAVSIYWPSSWRRQKEAYLCEDDLPWPELLELLKGHQRQRGSQGSKDEEADPDELFKMLMAQIPKGGLGAAKMPVLADEALPAGAERRRSRRRWTNPIEVRLTSPFHEKPQHGLVINRSTGGLAILTDANFSPGTVLFVRPEEAPASVPAVEVEVRHSRFVSKLCLIGCQYRGELPWNVKVWFG